MIYAQKFIFNANATVTIIDKLGILNQYPELKNTFVSSQSEVKILQHYSDEEAFFSSFDLCLLNIESWRNIIKEETTWLTHSPSMLILKA
jgi:hypothetical protein